jgi:hypothetical protein
LKKGVLTVQPKCEFYLLKAILTQSINHFGMKPTRLITASFCVVFIFISNYSIAQSDTLVRHPWIPQDHQVRTITDLRNHIKYVLDTSHIYIEALTQNGNRIWKTDPF